jgi:hypothetical protein
MTKTEEATSMELAIPLTGELLPLDAESDVLAEAVNRIRDLERQLASVRSRVGEELTRRMDMENLRKVKVGDYEITVDAPGAITWDLDRLHQALKDLADKGIIVPAVVDRVMPPKLSISQRELKKLLPTLSPEDRENLESCSEASARSRRVRVDFAIPKR